jgi:hypothetical protein
MDGTPYFVHVVLRTIYRILLSRRLDGRNQKRLARPNLKVLISSHHVERLASIVSSKRLYGAGSDRVEEFDVIGQRVLNLLKKLARVAG